MQHYWLVRWSGFASQVLHDSPRLWKKNYTLDPNKMKDRNKKQWALKEDVDLLESVIKTQKKIVSSVKKYSRRAGFAQVKCRQGKDGSESKFFFFFIVVVVFVTVMHFLLKTEDFVQNRLPILHFWLQKKVYSEQNPPHLVVSWHSSAAFLPNFRLFPSPRVQHCYKNTSQLIFLCSCKFGGLLTELRAKTWI